MRTTAESPALLAQIPLFSELTPREIEAIAARSVERRYRPGELLFSDGDPCEALHIIVRGSVKVCKASPSGREIMLFIEAAPTTIAEVPLFDQGTYPATAYAVDEVIALLLRCVDFRELCVQHPGVALKMMAVLGRRLRSLVALIDSITFGGVRQRLARLILGWRLEVDDDTFTMPITIQEIAMRFGTAREVVSRNLSRFQAHGLIRVHKRELVLLDQQGLLREAETEL